MPWKFAMCMQSASDDQIVNLQLAGHLPCSFTCQTNAHWAESTCQALSCSGRRGRKVWSLSSKNSHVQQTEAEGSGACALCWGICLEQAAPRPNMALALSPRSGLHFLPETDTPLSNLSERFQWVICGSAHSDNTMSYKSVQPRWARSCGGSCLCQGWKTL